MIKKRLALSIFVVVVLIFMVGLSGCDMGTNTIAEIEEVDKVEESRVEATFVPGYIISGRKINYDTNEGINGWEITLTKLDDEEFEPRTKTTVNNGNYTFSGLEPGEYKVKEQTLVNWVSIGATEKIVTIIDKDITGINFENAPLYSISGYKINADTEGGIEDWEITLTKLNGEEFEPIIKNTNEDGKYIFKELRAGEYRVEEEERIGWETVGLTFYDITLPAEGDSSEPRNYKMDDFINREIVDEEPECFDETIWAANDGPLTERFVERGNWATYVKYEIGNGLKEYSLYASQDHEAGTLKVYDNGDNIFVKYVIGAEDNNYKDGYCGSWSYLTEYHLHISESNDFSGVTNRQGNPIPGQFDHKGVLEGENSTGWINIEIERNNYDENIVYIAAHGVAQWCGYLCEIE